MNFEDFAKEHGEPWDVPAHFLKKLDTSWAKLGKRDGPFLKWLRDERADLSVFRPPTEDLRFGIPNLSYHLNDFEWGIACLGAKPNFGKSTLVVNMIVSLLELNPTAAVLDFSFDDDFDKRVQQITCCIADLEYYQITTSVKLTPEQQQRKDMAYQKVRGWIEEGRLKIYDSFEIYGEDENAKVISVRSYRNMIRCMARFRIANPDAKIVAFVDSWSNLDASDAKGFSELAQDKTMLEDLQLATKKLKVAMFCTIHLRKTISGQRIPTLDDLKGNGSVGYQNLWAAGLMNEHREDHLLDPIMYTVGERQFPVIWIKVLKSKVSSHEDPLFYVLIRDRCRIIPLTSVQEYGKYYQIIRTHNREVRK